MAESYRAIARIEKTQGRNGEVVAHAADGLPVLLRAGLTVALVPPALKGPRRHVVRSCSGEGDARLVSFSGVSTIGEAAALVGRTVLARVADLPHDLPLHDATGLVGREVTDATHGPLGRIEEVMRGPANDVWVVRGALGEVLVPVVGAFVVRCEPEGPIAVDLPAGLVEGTEGGAA